MADAAAAAGAPIAAPNPTTAPPTPNYTALDVTSGELPPHIQVVSLGSNAPNINPANNLAAAMAAQAAQPAVVDAGERIYTITRGLAVGVFRGW
jgi:hypothetical protein